MNHLLDTHTFIWFLNGDKSLSSKSRKAIENTGSVNFISVASLWEIAIKTSLGKLELRFPFTQIGEQILKNDFQVLPVTFEDTFTVAKLPFHHRDPFDRIIISQSITNRLIIITKDPGFSFYDVNIIW